MKNVYTVAQVNGYIKNMFTQDFLLQSILVKGEVSNCKYHSSGHIYFTLKDGKGAIACVMFAGNRSGLKFHMQEGQQVVVGGTIDVFERDGRYQLYAKSITLDGAGQLYERFEQLKRELAEQGLFAPEYKQPIPKYVRKVGIVTAPTGAAVRDIMNIASRRNPYVQLILYPALVQGEGAAKSIVRGIQALDAYGVDVIIAGRGGGSIEDLWAFNEECVARAIFDCHTPVISAVGHETDITIADFVADLRAPTPSAAAELAVYEYGQTKTAMEEIRFTLRKYLMEQIQKARHESERYLLKLRLSHPGNQLRTKKQQLTETEDRIRYLMEHKITEERNRILLCTEQMRRLSPLERLSGGYAFVSRSDGKSIRKINDVQRKDRIKIYLKDGMIEAEVTSVKEEGHGR